MTVPASVCPKIGKYLQENTQDSESCHFNKVQTKLTKKLKTNLPIEYERLHTDQTGLLNLNTILQMSFPS